MAEWIIEIKDGKFPIGKWTQLVRCKYCKHRAEDEEDGAYWCSIVDGFVTSNDYCIFRSWQKPAMQNLLLSAAYLMDEEGYNDEQIVEFWKSLTRWVEAIDEHLISIQTVADIIEKGTGLKCVSSTLKQNQ